MEFEDEKLTILDISNLDFNRDKLRVDKLVAQLSEACENSGFFYLKIEPNFGAECSRIVKAAKEIFQLPEDEKARLVNDETSQMKYKGEHYFYPFSFPIKLWFNLYPVHLL
jgi:isopenicillin N synthase-like dioxygenase